MSIASNVGLGFHPADSREALALIGRAEAAGMGTAWAVMSPIDRDTVTILAAAAVQTERIALGTAVVPAFTRHPLALATQALALEDLAPGRIRLGIGTSHQVSMVNAYGLPFTRPLAQLREYLQIIRPVLQEGAFAFAGEFYAGEATFRTAPGTPVLISALGEHAFELAGELADGAISWLCPPGYLREVAFPAIQRGARQANRPAPLLIGHALVAPGTDTDAMRQAARDVLAYYLLRPYYRNMFAAAGFAVDGVDLAPDALIDALVIGGDEAAIADGIRQRLDAGTDELIVTIMPIADPEEAHDAVFRVVSQL
ncbi:MAG: LLM class flavin-dependent oxidoreductase [Thermomicrobiales bacterium]